MSLTLDQVERVAELARIAVSAEEAAAVMAQLNRVLALVDELQAADTRGVAPMTHPLEHEAGVVQRRRPDEVTEPDRREEFQALAPAAEAGLYLVPRVIE
ncbi:MAG: Asp-tRNA(Asn)/Glu-tRNA(Gln) amidotransferase subunit GatC [Burkholderiales bacterium]|nr:Asp-tRNA(Asn)/Glu-tRNA(Gln) amidotransferase subunit GatC [Burkholderiales bacterium]